MTAQRIPGPAVLLGVAGLAATAIFVLSANAGSGFFFDDWDFLIARPGLGVDSFLEPHNEHLMLVPIAIYKLLLEVFGMDSARPFQVAGVIGLLAALSLVYAYIRRRVGPWLALAFVAPLAVCGPGWDNIIWPFQMGFTGALAAGTGALLLLEDGGRRNDRFACGLLVVGLCFSSLGLCFLLGAAVAIALDSRPWRERAFAVAIPALVYAVWWAGWGHHADNHFSWSQVAEVPRYLFEGLATGLASWTGVSDTSQATLGVDIHTLTLGRPLLIGALALLCALCAWRRRVPRAIWVPVSLALSFWALIALNGGFVRVPENGHYQLSAAVFAAMIVAGALDGTRPGRVAVSVALIAAAAAAVSNANTLLLARDSFRPQTQWERAEFTAVDIAADRVDPDFAPVPVQPEATAGLYLDAVDDYGPAGYTEAELAATDESVRSIADQALAGALRISLRPAPAGAGDCRPRALGGETVQPVDPGVDLLLTAVDGEVAVGARRYATLAFPVQLGTVSAGSAARLNLPADRSQQGWQLELRGPGTAALCPVPGP